MQIYAVGGAVRDDLLGLPVQDRDYVVVGATPEQMVAAGYTPVGKDFPVFLHPETHEEYALARTERKTAPGYKGFVFHTDQDVTLEEDLVRRDLTINAMARAADGTLFDPFHGQADLKARVFRHVSSSFAEDPVRILRLARFAARFGDFTVAPETNRLMQDMVQAGEVDALVPERVWQELARGLMESRPSHMFEVLYRCGALKRILPELDALWGGAIARVIDCAATQGHALPVRFSALLLSLGDDESGPKVIDGICQRLKIPTDCRDLAFMVAREQGNIMRARELNAEAIVSLLERCDAFRKPQRFVEMLLVSECAHIGRADTSDAYPQSAHWQAALRATQSVNAGQVAQAQANAQAIPQAIHAARVEAVQVQLGLPAPGVQAD